MKMEQNNVKSILYIYICVQTFKNGTFSWKKMNLRNDLFNLRYVARLNDWIECHYDGTYIYYYNNSMKNCENEYYYISMEDRENKNKQYEIEIKTDCCFVYDKTKIFFCDLIASFQ